MRGRVTPFSLLALALALVGRAEGLSWSSQGINAEHAEGENEAPQERGLAAVDKRSAKRRAKSSQKWYFLHVPKTAGTSFTNDAASILNLGGEDIIMREGCYGWSFAGVTDAMTLLRRPRDHVLSQYMHCRTVPLRPDKLKDLMPPTFEAWLRNWTKLRELGQASGDFTPRLRRWDKDLVPAADTRLPFKCYPPIDPQTHRLTCQRPYKFPEQMNASRAIQNLKEMSMVGIVEAYPTSLCLLMAKVLRYMPATCDCSRQNATLANLTSHQKHGVAPHSVGSYSEEVLRLVDELTREDTKLYKAGVERFLQDVRAAEAQHGMKILCDDTLTALRI
mmetsp:Transcript_22097/g.62766  ORF Transcript_22097/g.62766 Transcript_22097/m.62766 type:complete len:334 (+) Transcript_22097:99-1100(+)